MYDRYADMEKFITDPDKLQIVNGSEVYISSEYDYDIAVDLQGRVEDFEQLKPFIILVAKSICELDNTVQKFEYQHNWIALSPLILLSEPPFYYDIETVFINDPYIILKISSSNTGGRKRTGILMWFLSSKMVNSCSGILIQYGIFQKIEKT